MGKRMILWLAILAAFAMSATMSSAFASDGFDVQNFHPAADDGSYFTLYDSKALGQWQWVAGTAVNYGYHPFQWIRNDQRFRGIVDHEITQDLFVSAGLVGRWLQAGVELPVNWWVNFINPNVDPLAASPPDENITRLGDVKLMFKSELVELDKHWIGIALRPFIQFPTGSGYYYTGVGSVSGGSDVIFDFQPLERWKIALNVGALFRKQYKINNVTEANQLRYGLGTAVRLTKNLSTAAEVFGQTPFKDFWTEKDSAPLEMDIGLKYAIAETGLKLMGGAGMGIIRGAGAPRVRGFLGLAYHSPAEKPAPKPKFIRMRERIHFKTAKWEILPSSIPALDEVVTALETHPEIRTIQIEGHTDSRGSDAYNQKLSEKRAKSVYDYFVAHGVSPDRMTWIGYGETRPIDTNDTVEGRARNRRTVIRLTDVDYSKLPPNGDGALRYETGDPDLVQEGVLYPDR